MHQTSDTDIVTDLLARIADATERTPDSQKTQELLEQITEATERTNQYLGNDENNKSSIIGQIAGLRHDLRVGEFETEEWSVTPGQRLLDIHEKVSELESNFGDIPTVQIINIEILWRNFEL